MYSRKHISCTVWHKHYFYWLSLFVSLYLEVFISVVLIFTLALQNKEINLFSSMYKIGQVFNLHSFRQSPHIHIKSKSNIAWQHLRVCGTFVRLIAAKCAHIATLLINKNCIFLERRFGLYTPNCVYAVIVTTSVLFFYAPGLWIIAQNKKSAGPKNAIFRSLSSVKNCFGTKNLNCSCSVLNT